MTTLTLDQDPVAASVETTETHLVIHLADGRLLSVPLEWYPRLLHGTAEERANCSIELDGFALRWPDLDEDLNIEGLLAGKRSGESQASLERWMKRRAG